MTKQSAEYQKQIYRVERDKIARLNLEMVEAMQDPINPMTNADLAALIKRRPEVYGRFAGFIGKLRT